MWEMRYEKPLQVDMPVLNEAKGEAERVRMELGMTVRLLCGLVGEGFVC